MMSPSPMLSGTHSHSSLRPSQRSPLAATFEDPGGSILSSLVSARHLFLFGIQATLRKWRERPKLHTFKFKLELVGHCFVWHIQVLSWKMCESQHKQLEGSVAVHRSSAVVGHAPAIICRAPVVVCHALVSYIGVMCRRRVSVSRTGIMHRLSLVVRWSLAVGRPPSSAVSRWLSAVVRCRSCAARRWLLVVHIPLFVVRRWSSIVHRWSLLVIRCWSLAVGCRWSSSLIVIGGCRRKARLYMGRVVSGPFQASGHLKEKKSSHGDAHHSRRSQYPRLQLRVLHTY